MAEHGRLRRIQVGLEALDPIEVGARSHSLDVAQPLVADLGQGGAEVELPQRGVSRGDRFTDQDQLGGRQDARLHDASHRALTLDVEFAQRFELITEKLGAQRPAPVRRVDIEDAAAKAELAASLHQRLAPIAHGGEALQKILGRVAFAGLEGDAPARESLGPQGWPRHCGPGAERHHRPTAPQRVDRLQPPTHRLLVRRQPVEGEGFDRRKDDRSDVLAKPRARLLEGPLGICDQRQHRASGAHRQPDGEDGQGTGRQPVGVEPGGGRVPPRLQPFASRKAIDEFEQSVRHEIAATQKCARGRNPGRAGSAYHRLFSSNVSSAKRGARCASRFSAGTP